MQSETAEQVLELIRRLPPKEREKLNKELSLQSSDAADYQNHAKAFRALLGSIDVGEFLDPALDRETIYAGDGE